MADQSRRCPLCRAVVSAAADDCLACGAVIAHWTEPPAPKASPPSSAPASTPTRSSAHTHHSNKNLSIMAAVALIVLVFVVSRKKSPEQAAPAAAPAATTAPSLSQVEMDRAAMLARIEKSRAGKQRYDFMTFDEKMRDWNAYFKEPTRLGGGVSVPKGTDQAAFAESSVGSIVAEGQTVMALIALNDIGKFNSRNYYRYKQSNENNAVLATVKAGDSEILKVMMQRRWSAVNSLPQAAKSGFPEIAKILIENGQRPTVGLLTSSTEFFAREVIPVLGSRIMDVDLNRRTHLLDAVQKKRPDVVRAILEFDASTVNTPDSKLMTPLLWACKNGSVPMAKDLIAKGANVDIKGPEGRTPIMEAVMAEPPVDPELIKFLMSANANLYAKDSHGFTVYKMAKVMNREKLIPVFAEAYAPE